MKTLHKAKILQFQPDALDLFEDAIDAFENGDYVNAVYICNKAVEIDPICLEYQFFLSDIYIKMGLYFNAIKVNLELLSFEELIPEAYYNIAQCYFLMEDYENAFIFIKRGIELGIDEPDESAISRDMIERIDREKRFFLLDIENEHKVIVNMAEDLAGAGEFAAAEQLLNFIPKKSKLYLKAQADAAVCQFRLKKYAKSLKTTENILEADAENIYALCAAFQIYDARNEIEKRNDTVIKIKQKETLTTNEVLRICLIFLGAGMHSEALHFLTKFRNLKPFDESALYLQGIALYNCGFTFKAQKNMLDLLKIDCSNVLAKYYNKYFQEHMEKPEDVFLQYHPKLPKAAHKALVKKIYAAADSLNLKAYLERKTNLDEILWLIRYSSVDCYDVLHKFYAAQSDGFSDLVRRCMVDREISVSLKKQLLKLRLIHGEEGLAAITIDDNLKFVECGFPESWDKKHERFKNIWLDVFCCYAAISEGFEEKFNSDFDGLEDAFNKCVNFEVEDSAVCAYFAHMLGGHKLLKSIQSVSDVFNADKTQVQRLKATVCYVKKPKKRVTKRKTELEKLLENFDF